MTKPLRLHNTMTGKREVFRPADPDRVTMYVCGPTVYNHAHVGNFRPVVVFDTVFRLLRHLYGEAQVIYARNFTDIDDKIIAASLDTGKPISEITAHFSAIYKSESEALGALAPTLEPTATTHIAEMITLISMLLERSAAYSEQNHVLFDISQYTDYGALSNVNQDEMIAGARVEIAPYKRNPADFVLWKPAKDGEPGWETPASFGVERPGRPGWHLECSAMIAKTLGTTIDIHGGGQDLRFPHHENEIAQSVCAHGAPLARFWLHNGFLSMPSGKMSKSLGNVVLVRDLLNDWQGEVLRFALLSAHYRQPLEWSEELLTQSKTQLDRFYRLLMDVPEGTGEADKPFIDALCDDLNTPAAIARLHALRDAGDGPALKASAGLIGLLQQNPQDWFQGANRTTHEGFTQIDIDAMITARTEAKKARDFAKADEIRDTLKAQGIIIEDSAGGTTWRRE